MSSRTPLRAGSAMPSRVAFALVAALGVARAVEGQAPAPPDGKKIFATTCAVCHQLSGEGLEEKYPPLVGSEWIADDGRLVRIILHGMSGPVEVAGETYDGLMPGWGGVLKDAEVAAVASYVRNAWGNKSAPITAARVSSIRAASAARKAPWTAAELTQVVIQVKK